MEHSVDQRKYIAKLTYSMSLVSFYTRGKHQKTSGFLIFSKGLKETSGFTLEIFKLAICLSNILKSHV